MNVEVVTVMTTTIDLATMTPKTFVDIQPDDGVPPDLAYAAVAGACKATLRSLPERFTQGILADDPDGD